MAPSLGLCGECNQQFTTAPHAYKCVVCKRNFHPACLHLLESYAKEGSIFAALRETNCVVCLACREADSPVASGSRQIAAEEEEQVAQLTAKVHQLMEEKKKMEARILAPTATTRRAADLERKLESANQKIAHLESIALSSTARVQADKLAVEKLALLDKEMSKLRSANAKLATDCNM